MKTFTALLKADMSVAQLNENANDFTNLNLLISLILKEDSESLERL